MVMNRFHPSDEVLSSCTTDELALEHVEEDKTVRCTENDLQGHALQECRKETIVTTVSRLRFVMP